MTATLLTDARELIALMRGQARNPLLEQWQLARQRKWQRSGWWARYGALILCWLPWLAPYIIISRLPFNSGPDPQNLLAPLALGAGPLLLLAGLIQPRELRQRRLLLMVSGGLVSLAASFAGFRLYSSDVSEALFAISFCVLLPLFTFTLSGLFGALGHGLDITSDTGEQRRDQAAQDIRLSLLDNRDIVLAHLALHLPGIFRRLAWLGWGVMLVLVLSTPDLYHASFVLLPAMLGAVVCFSSQLVACVMLLLSALSIRLSGLQARARLSVLILFIAAQFGLLLASCFAMFDPSHDGDSGYSYMGTWGCLLLLSPLLLSVPLATLLRRGPATPAGLLARLLMLLSLLYTLTVLMPDLQYVSRDYVTGHLSDFVLSLLLPVIFLAGLWLVQHRSNARVLLLLVPVLFGALSLVLLIVLMFGMMSDSFPMILQELVRSAAAFSVGSVLAVQSSIFWGDWGSLNEPLIEWWRWPLHIGLQYIGISVLYQLALQQVRAWRMNQ